MEQRPFCEEELEVKITLLLRQCGISPRLSGHRYFRDAVFMIMTQPEIYTSVLKSIYPAIATRYRTTPYCVERAMRTALTNAYKFGNEEVLNEIALRPRFGSATHPSNKRFIFGAAQKLRSEEEI